jgi:aspartate racemase
MHKVAPAIEAATRLPFLHIADATAAALRHAGQTRAGLLGTRFTMEQPFLRERLEKAGIEVIIPDAPERDLIHRIIFEELVHGDLRPESRAKYVDIIEDLKKRGAQSAILGCTEIGLLVSPSDASIPLYDTARIHAMAAVDEALR